MDPREFRVRVEQRYNVDFSHYQNPEKASRVLSVYLSDGTYPNLEQARKIVGQQKNPDDLDIALYTYQQRMNNRKEPNRPLHRKPALDEDDGSFGNAVRVCEDKQQRGTNER